MNINYTSLNAVKVSNKPLERLFYVTRRAYTLGASLTRADSGECVITLAFPKKPKAASEAMRRVGREAFITWETTEGARIGE